MFPTVAIHMYSSSPLDSCLTAAACLSSLTSVLASIYSCRCQCMETSIFCIHGQNGLSLAQLLALRTTLPYFFLFILCSVWYFYGSLTILFTYFIFYFCGTILFTPLISFVRMCFFFIAIVTDQGFFFFFFFVWRIEFYVQICNFGSLIIFCLFCHSSL